MELQFGTNLKLPSYEKTKEYFIIRPLSTFISSFISSDSERKTFLLYKLLLGRMYRENVYATSLKIYKPFQTKLINLALKSNMHATELEKWLCH